MDVVKLWSSLLANCAIGSSVCSIPTAYFVQGTADVQFFGGYGNNNESSSSVVDSDSENSYTTGVNDDGLEGTTEEGEEEDDDDDEEEEEDAVQEEQEHHLIPVRVVDEIEHGSGFGSGCDGDREDKGNAPSGARENGDKCKKQTQGKQTQTKIHRNRYSREEYRCSMCPYTCTTEKAFLKHLRNCEPKDDIDSDNKQLNLSCPICGKDRKGEESLALHVKKHKDNKHFCCDICKFKTLQLKKLIQHRRMHTGEKPHLCPFCSYRSARRDNLRSHARRVHKKDNLPCDTFTPRSMILTPSKSK